MPPVLDSSPVTIRCTNCETEFFQRLGRCPGCGQLVSTPSSRIVLAVTLLLIFAGFGLTQYLVNLHRDSESSLAARWFTRGEQAMQAHLPATAADCYRTALSYDPENWQYRLHLAQALLADNRLPEARAHLSSLWEEEPADGDVNLTLARLYVRRRDYSNAVRYYSNAIDGVWSDEPRAHRIATRFELANFLLQQHNLAQAQAELVAIQADGPATPADQLLLGNLLLQVNEPQRAIQAFDAVLQSDPNSAQAWLGKAQASLVLADYKEAEHAITIAVDRDPKLDDARQQLEVVRELLRLDPGLRGLSLADRSERTAEAFELAMKRISSCATQQGITLTSQNSSASTQSADSAASTNSPAQDELQRLYTAGMQKQSTATEKALRKDPDAIEPTLQFVFDVQRETVAICPATEKSDRALLLLAQHEGEAVK
ncbi:MAG: tetratricopeptide repeat protein [Candidatus Korobacteraceae bacterium]